MSDFDLDHLVHLVVKRRLVSIYDGRLDDSIQTEPTVFFDRDHDDESTPPAFPDALLNERKRLLDARLGTREWYLVTEEPRSEWTEELRGDYGVLIVCVDDLAAARRALT